MHMKPLILILLCFSCRLALGTVYYVAINGTDSPTAGTSTHPFRTIQYGIDQLTQGDTLLIREGRYEESIRIPPLPSPRASLQPTMIKNYPNENVIIDGTTALKTNWRAHPNGIYSTPIQTNIWQFFANDQMQTSARWPDATAWTPAMWNKDTHWIQQDSTSSDGLFIDAPGGPELNEIHQSFTGAIAIMNVGSWLSFARTITDHKKNSNYFTYESIGKQFHHRIQQGAAFIEASLACLNTPHEWFFDSKKRALYWIPPNGKHPTQFNTRGKIRTYGITIHKADHIHIQGLNFFACTFNIRHANHITIEDCHIRYPSYSKRMLKETEKPAPTTFRGDQNTLLNCTFKYADGTGLLFSGNNGRIENCLFTQIDYSCVGGLHDCMVNVRDTEHLVFRQNTLDTGGNSVGIKGGSNGLFELNRVTHQGLLQHDGAAIQVDYDRTNGTLMQKNWIHDHIKFALRFDTPWLDKTLFGTNGAMRQNVIWNARPIVPKGDAHHIYNNTAFNNDSIDIAIFSDQDHGGYNTQTRTQNNAANQISGARTTLEPVPGRMISNWIGQTQSPPKNIAAFLVDPSQHDFRPKADSPLIDAGAYHPQHSPTYLGNAPDIGAYEFGDTNYWMAGYIPAPASSPIPQCGATDQSIHRDLIFQPGYQANTHHIYYGTHPTSLKKITTEAALHNVIQLHQYGITPKKGTTYYWQVDSQHQCGKVIAGPLWHYTTQR
jgi:hypothetical protein